MTESEAYICCILRVLRNRKRLIELEGDIFGYSLCYSVTSVMRDISRK